jgi:hypothetical protein
MHAKFPAAIVLLKPVKIDAFVAAMMTAVG